MGLQLWLPLNGDVKNYGLKNINVLDHGTSEYNQGKIGKCRSFVGSGYLKLTNSFGIESGKDFSCCYWIKEISNNTSPSFRVVYQCGNLIIGHYNDCFNIYNGSDLDFVYKCDTTDWVHCCLTYQSLGNIMTIYINGIKCSTHQPKNLNNLSSTTALIGKRNTETYLLEGYLNDFRLYDECLSPKQIKYISQAMICHYPMGNVDGKIGGRNLIRNSDKFLFGSSDFSIGQWRIAGNSTMVRSRVDITDPPECCKSVTGAYQAVGKHPPTLNDAECIGMDNFPYLSDCNIGDTCTFSAWARVVGGGENCYFGFSSYMTKSVKVDSYGYDDFLNNYAVDALNPDGSWTHIVIHFKLTASLTNNIYVGFLTGDKNVTVQACAFKLEKGNIVTPYTPAPEDNSQFYDNIIPDISGYRNNATVKDSTCPAWSDDSPRYLGSYRFDATKEMFLNPIVFSGFADSYTFSWWGENSQSDSSMYWGFIDGNRLNLYNTDGYLFWNIGDSQDNPFNDPVTTNKVSSYIDGKWHHYCVTGDGESNKLYVDGKIYGIAKTYRKITGTKIHINGWDDGANYKINGNISDFRIYATALSESDVLNLYQSSASLDSQGNLMLAGEVIE